MSTYPSKTRKVQCGYCEITIKEVNLGCQNQHNKPKLIKGERDITSFINKSNSKRMLINSQNEGTTVGSNRDDPSTLRDPGDTTDNDLPDAGENVPPTRGSDNLDENKLDYIIKKLNDIDVKIDAQSCSTTSKITTVPVVTANPTVMAREKNENSDKCLIDEKMKGCM